MVGGIGIRIKIIKYPSDSWTRNRCQNEEYLLAQIDGFRVKIIFNEFLSHTNVFKNFLTES